MNAVCVSGWNLCWARWLIWNSIDKDEYFNAMIRSHVSTGELKYLLLHSLTDDLGQATYFKGIDHSYYYEGYNLYRTEDL